MFARKQLVLVLLLVLLTAHAVVGQSPSTDAALITFQIPKMTFIAPVESPVVHVLSAASSGNIGRTNIQVRARGEEPGIIVFLIVRSNTDYRLVAEVVSINGSTTSPISVKSLVPAPLGGNARLWSRATDVRSVGDVELMLYGETLLAEGPRISRGGNNASTDNAIVLQLMLELPAGVIAADLALTMHPIQ